MHSVSVTPPGYGWDAAPSYAKKQRMERRAVLEVSLLVQRSFARINRRGNNIYGCEDVLFILKTWITEVLKLKPKVGKYGIREKLAAGIRPGLDGMVELLGEIATYPTIARLKPYIRELEEEIEVIILDHEENEGYDKFTRELGRAEGNGALPTYGAWHAECRRCSYFV